MRRVTLLRIGAVALYAVYWGLWLFGFVDIYRGDLPGWPRELFYGLTIGTPCFLVGAALASWWAPAVGIVFVVLAALPDHCVVERADGVTGSFCMGLAASDLPLVLAVTTPGVVAGVVAAKLAARATAGTRAGRRAAAG